MIGTQSLPALAFLAAISGLPGLPGLKGLPAPQSKEYGKAKAEAVAADTLPPPWKPSWRLALENRALFAGLMPIGPLNGPVKLQQGSDPRRVHVSVDPDSGTYTSATEVGEVTLVPTYRRPLIPYTREYAARTFQEKWQQKSRESINSLGSNTPTQKQGLSLPIPVRLPQRISSILGPGGPALNVSGSESIRLSGTSNWTNAQIGLIGQKKSLFPSLDMQQDLDIRLEGQLSDRIKVNLLQNSANQVPLANRIAINYRGDEDDFVQALDLGNTSLSLPGTQYVSYSGRNEGLFGVKFASRIGALDFTALASKQEGRSERAVYTGGSAVSAPKPFTDWDWVKGQYFLLYDPNFGTFYDVDQGSIRIYLDDATPNNDRPHTDGKAVIDPGDVFHMGAPTSDTAFVYGRFQQLISGPDKDYEILNNVFAFHDTIFKVIRLKVPLLGNQILAATYSARPILGGGTFGTAVDVGGQVLPPTPGSPDSARTVLKLLRVPRELQSSVGRVFNPNGKFALVRELELKNIYNLGGYGIDPKSFKLKIKFGQDEPPTTDIDGIPYVEMVGLDTWNEQNAQPIKSPPYDGEVDRVGYTGDPQTRSWVDYENGTIMLPDFQPFAPRLTGPNAKPFDIFLHDQARRRQILDGAAGSKTAPNPGAYDIVNPLPNDAQYYFVTEFAAARSGGSSDITLGRGNILDNSEAVMVNGERWVRDRDYTIDYDLGRIQLKKQLGPSDQLSIDYSYAPLFAQASKTLIGSAFRIEGRDRSLGGAFLYESKGAQDIRPRLGEEPSRTLITDLNTEWRFKPSFMTRFADALPGVRTTAPSDLTVQAEAGMSFPNPNTRNEVYVDDMEGVRDAVGLAMDPKAWRLSGVPRRPTAIVDGDVVTSRSYLTLPKYFNAELHWYSPVPTGNQPNDPELVRERELRPLLEKTDPTAARSIRSQMLALSVPRTPDSTGFALGDTMWAGLTYNLDAVGLDLSRSQFIELWVNDWNDHHDPLQRVPRVRGDGDPGSSVKLHIDLGRVSEDQMRAPNRPPNGRVDTEDLPPRDNQLDPPGDNDEDTGIDGVRDAGEVAALAGGTLRMADLVTASSSDPEGDDYGDPPKDYPSAIDPRRYVRTNGTEKNRNAFPLPDTEDLNLNERPDTTESYFEYTIDLGQLDSPYLVTDVLKSFSGESFVDSTRNGWRRYRIPISDSLRVRFGSPDLTIARHLRLWVDGMRADERTAAANYRPMLMLGSVDIVGSRWVTTDLTPTQRDTLRTSITLNAVNTADNADVYAPPFDPGNRTDNKEAKRREQSISMEFSELFPADTLEAYKTFSIPEDYSRYGVLRWFASSFDVERLDASGKPAGLYDPVADSLFYFVRFASDDKGQSYYEVKRKMPRTTAPNAGPNGVSWEEVLAELEQLSVVKLAPDFPSTGNVLYRTALANGDSLILRGRPSFTRLLRISFGVLNQSSIQRYAGQLWFDEIRATDVKKDVGLADRVLVNGHWANLMDYNVSWTSRDADFLSVGETRGTGSRNTNLNISTRFEPHRFFEGTGILLPVSFAQNESKQRPRFAAGDDIVRSGSLETLSESRSVSRTITTSYSRVWSDRSNPLLLYTLGGITANWSRTTSDARNPTNVNNSTTVNGAVSYQIAPRQLLQLPMPFTKAKLFPLPERFYWNYGVTTTKSSAFTRTFGSDTLRPSSSQNGRAATVNFGADTRPFDLLSHHFEGQRNLALEGVRQDQLGFINFGRLTSWRQSFSSHLSVAPHPFLRPSFNWSSNYSQNYNLQSKDLFQRAINNGQEVSMNMDLPFDKIGGTPGVTPPPRPATPSPGDSGKVARPRRSPLPWRSLLARLGTISTDGRIGRTSNYSLIAGNASPLYMVGLADNPGFGTGRIVAQPGNVSSNGLDWRTNARSTFPLAFGSQIQARFSYGDVTRDNNGVKSRDRDWRFPDFEVQYGRIASVVGLTHFLDSPQLRTAYSRSYSVNYQNSHSVRAGTSRSDDFRPLFSVRGRLRNGTDADLRLERRSTVRESFLLGNSKATDQTTDVNFSLTRSYSQGQKVNFLGKTTTVKTNVSLALTTVYSRQKGGIKVGNEEKLANPVDRTRLSVNGTGSYGFSSNVTGDLALGFSHFRETNGIYRRSIRVELRGQFRF